MSFGYRVAGNPFEFSMPSTLGEHPSCSLEATRQATIGSTRSMCQWPTGSTKSIWKNCGKRG